jgi:hypothetical protein
MPFLLKEMLVMQKFFESMQVPLLTYPSPCPLPYREGRLSELYHLDKK